MVEATKRDRLHETRGSRHFGNWIPYELRKDPVEISTLRGALVRRILAWIEHTWMLTISTCTRRTLETQVTGLAANSVYRFRVRAANLRSIASEWSAPTQAATAQRKGLGVGYDRPSSLIHRPECAEQVPPPAPL